jgi:hypothetical protein
VRVYLSVYMFFVRNCVCAFKYTHCIFTARTTFITHNILQTPHTTKHYISFTTHHNYNILHTLHTLRYIHRAIDREDLKTGVFVENLSEQPIGSAQEALEVYMCVCVCVCEQPIGSAQKALEVYMCGFCYAFYSIPLTLPHTHTHTHR